MAAPKPLPVALLAGVLVALAVLVVVLSSDSEPSEILATAELSSGEPFELSYTSTGAEAEVRLDMHCERCSLPVAGRIECVVDGRTLDSAEVSAGSRSNRGFGEGFRLQERLLLEVPEVTPGKRVTVRGTLTVGRELSQLTRSEVPDAPDPIVRVLRVRVET